MTVLIGPTYEQATMPTTAMPNGRASRGRSTAIEGTGTVQFGWDGIRPEQLREWNENQSPYRNLAGNKDVAERAVANVMERVRQYDTKTLRLQRKWQVLNYLLQGNSLVNWEDPDGPHSPILFQMTENLEARITDAVLSLSSGRSDWFQVRGRDNMDRRQEDLLAAFLDWILDKNRFKSRVPEMVRTMLVHAFAVVKSRWVNESDYFVEKKRKKIVGKRGPKWETRRREVRKVTYSGPRLDLVDPFWFMCDTTRTDPQEMLWVGDRCRMTYEQILDLEDQGVFMNARMLEGQEPVSWGDMFSDWAKSTRTATYPYDNLNGLNRPTSSPKEFHVIEVWGKFDIYNTGISRECVITVANGNVVLQVRENPFDDKHRPYAVARACKYPFDFHSVGPLDHAIQLSIEIDTHRSLAVQGSRLAVCPLIFTDDKGDLGDSIYGIGPGSVFETSSNVKMTNIRSPLPDMVGMEGVLRQDAEETVGAPRIYTGADMGNTMSATEYRGRLLEANKRIRSYIRSFTDMCETMLRNIHSLCSQYMSSAARFRVLGKRGKALRAYEEMDPEVLDADIDFEFVAISNLAVTGMEATNLQLYLNTAAPFVQQNPGILNIPKFFSRFAMLLLGEQAAEMVDVPDDPRDLMGQAEEIDMMLRGDYVATSRDDDDEGHLGVIRSYKRSGDYASQSDHVRALIDEHEMSHEMQAQQKVRQRAALANRMPAFQQAAPAFPGQGSTPADGGSPQMNLQRSAMAGASQTNGPVNGQQIAKPGREQGFFGEQNQGSGQEAA